MSCGWRGLCGGFLRLCCCKTCLFLVFELVLVLMMVLVLILCLTLRLFSILIPCLILIQVVSILILVVWIRSLCVFVCAYIYREKMKHHLPRLLPVLRVIMYVRVHYHSILLWSVAIQRWRMVVGLFRLRGGYCVLV